MRRRGEDDPADSTLFSQFTSQFEIAILVSPLLGFCGSLRVYFVSSSHSQFAFRNSKPFSSVSPILPAAPPTTQGWSFAGKAAH